MTFLKAATAATLPAQIGLQALKAHDRSCIEWSESTKLTGSVDMDEAFRIAEGQSNRWDYGIGFRIADEEYSVWVEPHSATSAREITTMLRKLQWLKDKLAGEDFEKLRKLTDKARRKGWRQFTWIAHGKIGFRTGTPDANRLAKAGLNFPLRKIKLGQD